MQFVANKAQEAMGPAPGNVVENDYKERADGAKMKALVWFGAEDVRVMDAAVPEITQPDDIIGKVTGTTICGSDLHLYHSEILGMQKGDILGHEFCIQQVGPNVTKFKPGDRAVVSFQIACGKCRYCQKKLSSFCERTNDSSLMQTMYGGRDAGFFGYSHFTGGFPGGQAEYVRVPFGDVNCQFIPDEVSDEEAIYLSDVLPTSYHCVVDTGVTEGDTVGVWGLGPIGLAAVKWAQLKGAKRVIGIDGVPFRLEYAREHLGIETINFNEVSDIPKKILEMVPGGLDKALDCGTFHEPKTLLHKVQKALLLETDVPETANEMIMSTRKAGSCGVIAAYAGLTNNFNIGALMEKGIRFIGNGQAPVHLYRDEILNDYIKTGKFDVRLILSHRFAFEDMAKLYGKFDKRVPGLLKTFVETRFSAPPKAGYPTLTRVDDLPEK
ncbi:GroES-like protein [Cystobasidium minutum MCA 4210]|uniref:GroES-like protein n=1 Tax=Cystobasidium minutum MCA 4210 TaxID=1397322 RepID=UPI0034CE88F8|eukprot:jgi/Rhomi1/144753/e_gw1.4.951.1